MNWEHLILAVIQGVTEIRARHAAVNPAAPPLTDEQVHELLLVNLRNAHGNIAQFFIDNGLPIPE